MGLQYIEENFTETGKKTGRNWIYKCRHCQEETFQTKIHLYRRHRTIHDECVQRELFSFEERPGARKNKREGTSKLDRARCLACGFTTQNSALSTHRMKQGQGGIYGCRKFNEFYTAYPDQPLPPYSITKELHEAIVNNNRQPGENFEKTKKKRLDELKQLYAGDDKNTGAVYFKLLSTPSTSTMAELVRKCVYIGSAVDINKRQQQHKLNYTHSTKLLPKAYVDEQRHHTNSILIRGHEEMVRSVEYLALSLKNIHRESSGAAEETGQWHSINDRMPWPQLPPGMTSGVEDEQKMRKLVAEVLLDALFSPEQLDLEPFEAELAADIQQEDEDDSSQQSSSTSSSQQASTSSLQQQPATAKTPSRKLSASTSNISKRPRFNPPAPLCTSTPDLPSTSDVPPTPTSALGRFTLSSASSSTSFPFSTICEHCQIAFGNPSGTFRDAPKLPHDQRPASLPPVLATIPKWRCFLHPHHEPTMPTATTRLNLFKKIEESHCDILSAIKLIHREHDPIVAFAVNSVHPGHIVLSTGREIQELTIQKVLEEKDRIYSRAAYSSTSQNRPELDIHMQGIQREFVAESNTRRVALPEKFFAAKAEKLQQLGLEKSNENGRERSERLAQLNRGIETLEELTEQRKRIRAKLIKECQKIGDNGQGKNQQQAQNIESRNKFVQRILEISAMVAKQNDEMGVEAFRRTGTGPYIKINISAKFLCFLLFFCFIFFHFLLTFLCFSPFSNSFFILIMLIK